MKRIISALLVLLFFITPLVQTLAPEGAPWGVTAVSAFAEEDSEAGAPEPEPTAIPEEPTVTPDPTAVPEEPTATPELTPVPEEATAAPATEEPSATQEEATQAPDEPTATPEEPTAAPEGTAALAEPSATPPATPEVTEEPTPEVEPIDTTRDVSFSLSFAKGWVEIAKDASLTETAGGIAFATLSRGIGYALLREFPGAAADFLLVAFAADGEVKTAYIPAKELRPLSEAEISAHLTACAKATDALAYNGDAELPLLPLGLASPSKEDGQTEIIRERTRITLSIGESVTVQSPLTDEATAVVWITEDEAVATVDEQGILTGVAEGDTVLTLALPGDISVAWDVTVVPTVRAGRMASYITDAATKDKIIKQIRSETSDYIAERVRLLIYGDATNNPYYPGKSFPSTTGSAPSGWLGINDKETGYLVDLYSTQCMGYAEWAFYKIFGFISRGSSPSGTSLTGSRAISTVGGITLTQFNATTLKASIAKAKAGAHIRILPKSGLAGDYHSITYLTKDANGFWYLDAGSNGAGVWSVRLNYNTYSGFVSDFANKTIEWIRNPSSYPSFKQASVLTISSAKYPINKKSGEPFSVNGFISSQSDIKTVTIKVTTTSGAVKFTKTVAPNLKVYSIFFIDAWMLFSGLANGTYDYTIYAKDASGAEVTMTKRFTVGSAATTSGTATTSIPTYAITYNANGGTGAPGAQTKTQNVTLKLSSVIPTRSGYTFQGWGTSASATTVAYAAGANYTGNAKLTLYAIWKQYTYTLTLATSTGGSISIGTAGQYASGTVITLKATPNGGYRFAGWTGTGGVIFANSSSASTSFTMPAANVTVKANFAKITPVEAFVTRLYVNVLGRQPDTKGLNNWVNGLVERKITGAEACVGFYTSPELAAKKLTDRQFIDNLYRTCLNRKPDTKGINDWLKALSAGATRISVMNGFIVSPEFGKICQSYGITRGSYTPPNYRDRNMQVTMFVVRLYRNFLGRSPENKGLEDWCRSLLAAGYSGSDVAFGFYDSPEFKNKRLTDEQFITTLYNTLLGRAPDAKGLSDWKRSINLYGRRSVYDGFIVSPEWKALMRLHGIR